MTEATPRGPLHGLRVIELAHVMAGPSCARLLADLGAEVIKLERPGGEDCRRMAPPWQGDEAAGFLMLNRNKRGIVVDLKHPDGRQVLLDLVKEADVLIENFRKGTMERLGVGYDTLASINPGLIFCEISGFGRTGPYADRGGFDLVAQAMSGVLSVTGTGPDGPPIKAGVPVGDIGAGLLAAVGILAALAERQRTGRGQRVDTSLFEACVHFMTWPAATWFATGERTPPMGTAHALDAPYQAFEAADGWFVIGAANQANWERLIKAIGCEALGEDPRFVDNPARVANLTALVDALTPVFTQKDKAHWLALLEDAGVPAGPINDIDAVLDDPQLRARHMIHEVTHKTLGTVGTVGSPIQFSGHAPTAARGAPTLGEHTEDILREAGYDDARIEALVATGAVYRA
ncbi:MAG: CoA transferase [Pseudomonadota bacterium]